MDKRHIVISDIHGCFDEFCLLLEKLNYNASADELYLLGDNFDRGTKSHLMAKWILENIEHVHLLIGNHEELMLNEVGDWSIMYVHAMSSLWYLNSGEKTRDQFMDYLTAAQRQEIYDIFYNAPAYKEVTVEGHDYLLVHAGFYPVDPLNARFKDKWLNQPLYDLTWIREEWLIDNTRPPWTVVFGHTPISTIWKYINSSAGTVTGFPYKRFKGAGPDTPDKFYSPLTWNNKVAIDGGCVFGGRLNAYILNDQSFVSVDPTKETMAHFLWGTNPTPDKWQEAIMYDSDMSFHVKDILSRWICRVEDLGYAGFVFDPKTGELVA